MSEEEAVYTNKGIDSGQGVNRKNILCATNNLAGIPVQADERRLIVFDSGDRVGMRGWDRAVRERVRMQHPHHREPSAYQIPVDVRARVGLH